jgi:carbon storage regulator
MLVLSRKFSEKIVLDGNVVITVVAIRGKTVRLGIEAPKEVSVMRGELLPAKETDPEKVASK